MNTSDTKGTNGNSEANEVLKQPLENTTSTTSKKPKKHEEPNRSKEEVSKLKFYSRKVPITRPNFKKPPKKTYIRKPRAEPTRRSTRLAKGKRVQRGVDVWNLLKYLVGIGLFLLSTTPVIDQNENISMKLRKTLEELADEQRKEEEIPVIDDENPKLRRLRYYHHMLDQLSEKIDSEDRYQDYVWKVDKIIRTTRRKDKIYLFVQWIQGNRSWISLNSLRLHDPYSCVVYATKKKLLSDPDWEWTKDYINDTK